jgi:hypothetical protein
MLGIASIFSGCKRRSDDSSILFTASEQKLYQQMLQEELARLPDNAKADLRDLFSTARAVVAEYSYQELAQKMLDMSALLYSQESLATLEHYEDEFHYLLVLAEYAFIRERVEREFPNLVRDTYNKLFGDRDSPFFGQIPFDSFSSKAYTAGVHAGQTLLTVGVIVVGGLAIKHAIKAASGLSSKEYMLKVFRNPQQGSFIERHTGYDTMRGNREAYNINTRLGDQFNDSSTIALNNNVSGSTGYSTWTFRGVDFWSPPTRDGVMTADVMFLRRLAREQHRNIRLVNELNRLPSINRVRRVEKEDALVSDNFRRALINGDTITPNMVQAEVINAQRINYNLLQEIARVGSPAAASMARQIQNYNLAFNSATLTVAGLSAVYMTARYFTTENN